LKNNEPRSLNWALTQLARAQGQAIDALRLQACVEAVVPTQAGAPTDIGVTQVHAEVIRKIVSLLGIQECSPLSTPDPARLPALALLRAGDQVQWCKVEQQSPAGQWMVQTRDGSREVHSDSLAACFWIDFRNTAAVKANGEPLATRFQDVFKTAMKPYCGAVLETVFASAFIGFLTLGISLYSMQIYDRVIPTGTIPTLVTLTIGVGMAIVIELAMKYARSNVMQAVTAGVDARCSREIFERLMRVRLDGLPASVGSLASQLRGYEQVRNYYTSNTLFTIVDVPIGLVMLAVIGLLAGPIVAAIPAGFAVLALVLGLIKHRQVRRLASDSNTSTNKKTGLLVEALEGAETIKHGGGSWKFLSRWIDVNTQAMRQELNLKKASDGLSFWTGTMQQLAYAGLIAVGAIQIIQGHMTMGALIACSIISGRVMAPILGLPGLMVQQAYAKSAIEGLEALYQLPCDNQGVTMPLVPERLMGQISLQQARFAYPASPMAIEAERIDIAPGERIGIIGAIGSGKSTLLRLTSGLYAASTGKVLIDGLDVNQISRTVLSQQIGFLQQEHRLFQGTLRENLLIGLNDPGDDALRSAMDRSGLLNVISRHPKGLDLPIHEGGHGLSGGQRQLVAFTRLLLANPSIYMLDEPTANMDEAQERRCIAILKEEFDKPWQGLNRRTCIVVTHKNSVLNLVDRLLVVKDQKVVIDGPRDAVLERLSLQARASSGEPNAQQNSVAIKPNFAPRVIRTQTASIA
jgi:ATP-binding cassette, subfamily C, bacterial LapB